MGWRHVCVYVVLAALLATLSWLTAPPPPPPPSQSTPRTAPGLAVRELTVDAHGARVRAVRSGERWQVVEPPGAAVTSDLVSALLGAVLDTRAEPVAAAAADQLSEFGLDQPTARITMTREDGPPVTLLLGAANPAETGIYGRLEGNPQVVLLGLNVRYYVDLLTR